MSILIPLALANFFSVASMMAFVMVVGPLIRQLNLEEWHGGLMVSVAGVSWMLLARPWGHLSDRKGRKKVLLIAIAGFALTYLGLAASLELLTHASVSVLVIVILLTVVRGGIGLFYAGIPVIVQAFIADTFEANKRTSAMAAIGFANALGMIFGPLLASLLVAASLTLPIYFAVLLPVLAWLVIWKKLPSIEVEQDMSLPKPKWHDPRLRLPMLSGFVAMSCVIAAQTLIGFFAIDALKMELQQAAQIAGYALTAVGVTLVVVQGGIMKSSNLNPVTMLIIGSVIAAIGFVSLIWVSAVWQLIAAYAVIAVGMGLVFPGMQALTADSVDAHEQGTASGTVSATYGLAMIVAPIVATLTYQIAYQFSFIVFAASLTLLAVISLKIKFVKSSN